MTDSNAALARRWFEEVWNQKSEATVHELLHRDATGHLEGGDIHGPDAFLAARAGFLDAFRDMRVTVDAVVSEGADAVVRWTARGTHGGDGLGVAASFRPVTFRGMTWLRFSGGQIVEGWDRWNLGALLQELQMPTLEAPATKRGSA